MARREDGSRGSRWNAFLDVGIWLLFFALLVPAGFVGYVIGKEQAGDDERAAATATAPESTEGIEAAPAFSTEDLAAEPREAWITNGGSLSNRRYSPLDQIDTGNVEDLRGRLDDRPRRLRRGGEVLGGGAADRLPGRALRPDRRRRRLRRPRRGRRDPLALRGEARAEDQHGLLRLAQPRRRARRGQGLSRPARRQPRRARPAHRQGRLADRRSAAGRRATRSQRRRSTTTVS